MESEEKHNAGVKIDRCVFFFFTFEEFKCSNDVPACQAGSVFGTSVWQCCFYLYLNFSASCYRQHCFLYRSFCISIELTVTMLELHSVRSLKSSPRVAAGCLVGISRQLQYSKRAHPSPTYRVTVVIPPLQTEELQNTMLAGLFVTVYCLTTMGFEQYSAELGLIVMIFNTVLL